MGLEELNEDIHRRDYEASGGMKNDYDPRAASSVPAGVPFSSKDWGQAPPEKPGRFAFIHRFFFGTPKRTRMTVAVAAIVLLVASFPLIWRFLFNSVNVTVAIVGPKNVASGETVTYSFRYSNRNILSAKGAELSLAFPDSFKVDAGDHVEAGSSSATIPVGGISGKGSGSVVITGKFYGSKGELDYPKARLSFSPFGVKTVFTSDTQIGVTIVSSPLVLDITVPQETSTGDDMTYIVEYRNDSEIAFSRLQVRLAYPDGFRFRSSKPTTAAGGMTWNIGTLAPHAGGTITIKGSLSGMPDDAKVLRATFGVLKTDNSFLAYDKGDRTTRMVAAPLSVVQTVNGKSDVAVYPGSQLQYTLKYVNNGSIGLRDVIVTLDLDPINLDLRTIKLGGRGTFDATRNVIVWKASDVPSLLLLEPGAGGEVSFNVGVRKDIGTSGTAGKNLFVRTIARIDSPDIPLENKIASSNTLDASINSLVFFAVNGYFADAAIPNTGPMPPKVGQTTTYTMRFGVTNYLNDIGQLKVSVSLPSGVKFLGKKSDDDESVVFNDRSNLLVWNIGSMPGGKKSVRTMAFQVSITPAPNEINQSPSLIRSAVLEGTDLFTKVPIRIDAGGKTTALREDTSLSGSDFIVSTN